MKKPKISAAVVAAKQAMDAKKLELAAARETVQRLEDEYAKAAVAMREAQDESDALLPQCRMVSIRWRSTTESNSARVVILRRTPSGMLVVRHAGFADGSEYRFKWAEHRGVYVQAEKRSFFASDSTELRDVPPEYMPVSESA